MKYYLVMFPNMLDTSPDVIELSEKEDYVSQTIRDGLDDLVVWQNEAKEAIVEAITNGLNSITIKKWPLAVLFFYWPSGVGKSEIAHALAQITMWDPNRLTKVKCEHFQQSHTFSNLIGSPKGYVWSDQESILGKNIYKHIIEARKEKEDSKMIAQFQNFNIIVFDEIEKAHPKIHQALLGIMDDGKITLSNLQEIDFSESIIIMTSNIGEREKREFNARKSIWFNIQDDTIDRKKLNDEAFKLFSPEFLGRIDARIEFKALTQSDCKKIVSICVDKINDVLFHRSNKFETTQIQLELEESVYDFIISKGYSNAKWARQLVREFNSAINAKLGKILSDTPEIYDFPGKEATITATMKEGKVKFELRKKNIIDLRKNNVVPLLPNT